MKRKKDIQTEQKTVASKTKFAEIEAPNVAPVPKGGMLDEPSKRKLLELVWEHAGDETAAPLSSRLLAEELWPEFSAAALIYRLEPLWSMQAETQLAEALACLETVDASRIPEIGAELADRIAALDDEVRQCAVGGGAPGVSTKKSHASGRWSWVCHSREELGAAIAVLAGLLFSDKHEVRERFAGLKPAYVKAVRTLESLDLNGEIAAASGRFGVAEPLVEYAVDDVDEDEEGRKESGGRSLPWWRPE